MAVTDWAFPSAVREAGSFTNPSNAFSENGLYSQATTVGWYQYGQQIVLHGFNLSLPAGARVTSVEIAVKSYFTATPAISSFISLNPVFLRRDVATNENEMLVGWPASEGLYGETDAIRTVTVPGHASVTGVPMSEWTNSVWASPNLGLVFSPIGTTEHPFGGSTINVFLDAVKIRLLYDTQSSLPTSNMFLCF